MHALCSNMPSQLAAVARGQQARTEGLVQGVSPGDSPPGTWGLRSA